MMIGRENIRVVVLAMAICAGLVAQGGAQGRPPMRTHTETEAQRLELAVATIQMAGARIEVTASGRNTRIIANGLPFDPGAAEFWQGDPRSGWQYDALGGAVPLGLDANFGHVQPDGSRWPL